MYRHCMCYHLQSPLSDVSSIACSTTSQESKQMIASQQTIEDSITTMISSSLTKQSCFSSEQSSSQKKEMATITQNAEPSITSYTRGIYTSMSQSHTSQHWTHLPQCEFVKLAMIRREKVRRGGPEEEMIRLAQQGKI